MKRDFSLNFRELPPRAYQWDWTIMRRGERQRTVRLK